MAGIVCIPLDQANILKNAVREGSPIGDIAQLYNMTSKERREAFGKYLSKDMASFINKGFEEAMLSNQKKALQNWVKNTFSPEAKTAGREKTALDKIEQLDKEGLLTPDKASGFLEDLVADKLGITITAEEAQKISDLSKKVAESAKKEFTKFGPDIEYWKSKREFENYLESLTPTPKLKVATSVIARATMLFSLKSPIVNIESNTVNAVTEAFARRIESLSSAGLVKGNKEAIAYMKYASDVFAKTGYDITRMISFADGSKKLGEDIIHSQGTGTIRKIGRFYTDVVFNKLMTAPDVAFASYHYADAANIYANAIAKSEGLTGDALKKRVDELFLDSVAIEPKTDEGKSIRDKARLEAERGTYTNDSDYSKVGLTIRKAINLWSGDLRLGDNLMPFVKVPATVVETSFDYGGTFLPIETLAKLKDVINAKKEGDPQAFKNAFDRRYIRKVTRAGIGITTAFILSGLFDPDEFIGEYPTSQKEQELLKLKNASENSIKIGGKWISLDYFGPLAAPFVGMMYAKKYGTNPLNKIMRYAQGTALQASRIPGFRQFYDIYGFLEDLNPAKTTPEDLGQKALKFTVDFFRSRTIPALLSDFAKGTDKYVRDIEKNDVMGLFLQSIPAVRQKYPEKLNIFGEKVEGEGFWNSMLFGSRSKIASDDPVVIELSRLAQKNQLPSITDVEKTSPRAKELKTQIGDEKFREFYVTFGTKFKNQISDLMKGNSYKVLDDEKKKQKIDNIKTELFDRELKRAGYKKPKK